MGAGVLVGGTGVLVGVRRRDWGVGGLGGTGVSVDVAVGGTGVFVGVAVGGTGVLVGVPSVAPACWSVSWSVAPAYWWQLAGPVWRLGWRSVARAWPSG